MLGRFMNEVFVRVCIRAVSNVDSRGRALESADCRERTFENVRCDGICRTALGPRFVEYVVGF